MRASTVPSSREANKALLRRYKTGILNDRDVDALGEVGVADYLDHAAFPGQAGLEAASQHPVAGARPALDHRRRHQRPPRRSGSGKESRLGRWYSRGRTPPSSR
jgi:hypothetical protein